MKRRIGIYKDKILVEGAGTKVNNYEIAIEDISNTECNESTDSGGEDSRLYLKYDNTNEYFMMLWDVAYGYNIISIVKVYNSEKFEWAHIASFSSGFGDGIVAISVDRIISEGGMRMDLVDYLGIGIAYEEGITNREEILTFAATFKEEISKLLITKEEFFEGSKILDAEGILDLMG